MAKRSDIVKESKSQRTILDDAKELVYGPRAETYGHPSENFQTTADMWTAFLRQRVLTEGVGLHEFEFSPADVAMFMTLVKVARLANTPGHRDSLTDIAGYAATAELCGGVE